jgi:osmotically-inducible protein OsmY
MNKPFPPFKIAIASALTVLALTSVVGCSSSPTRESTGQYVDDSVITGRVKAAILNEPTLKSSEINVETFKGRVQLSGFVSSEERQQTALSVARNVPGVTEVKDDMRLK